MRRIITLGLAMIMFMSTFAISVRAEASSGFTASAAQDPVINASLARGAYIVGSELVFPNGIMLSTDAGTGLLDPTLNPNAAPRATVIPCSAGYTCLYEHAYFGGRRLQWHDHGQVINLTNYGFNDAMSSWINNNNVDARWFYDINARGTTRCMQPYTSVSYVGWIDNDEASSLAIYTDGRAC